MILRSKRFGSRSVVSALAVAGLVGGALSLGTVSAAAAPAPVHAQSGDCKSYWPAFQYTVCGEIKDLYDSLGGPSSSLSFPKANEVTNPDGSKRQEFLGGAIVWTAATGAYVE